jgi:hypothetical protein
MSKDRKRLVVAGVVAPLVTPLVLTLYVLLAEPRHLSHEEILMGIAFNALLYLPFAYAAEVLFGLPLLAIFQHRKIRSMAAFALGGAIIGCIVVLLLAANGSKPMADVIGSPGWFRTALVCAAAASTSAVVFQAIAFH